MRAVIDTNVLVRAIIMPHGSVGPVLMRLRRNEYQILYAQSLLAELLDVLNRPRIRGKYQLSDTDIQTILSLILLRGEAVQPEQVVTICRDPKDNKFLEVAMTGRADVIVSADDDLLVLRPFAGIPIVPPFIFLQMLANE